jgi:WS/DGAT/MGAT family acyltransferase
MGVLLSLADRAPDSVSESGDVLPPTHSSGNGRVFSGKRRTGVKMLRNPRRAIRLLRQSAETAASMSRFITRRSDPDTVLKGELGGHKQAVWEGPISLDEVKRIGRILGGTVNDVLIAMLAGALRKYMLYHHEKISVNDLHSFVPVNLRSPDSEELLGNQFGFVFLSLPVGVGDPVRRLNRVHEHMNQLKSSNEAIATFGLLHLLGSAPGIQEAALSIVDSKGTAVTTNVPGPREQLYFAGAPINTLMAWVPKSGHVGLGISILSYNGGVYLGIAADDKLVPDPERMLTYFCEEFNLLSKLADEQEISRGSGTAPMLDMLNEALGTLDQILEESQPVAVQEVSLADDRCHGLTKSGRRCKNKALSESEYCHIHVLTDDPDRELA